MAGFGVAELGLRRERRVLVQDVPHLVATLIAERSTTLAQRRAHAKMRTPAEAEA